MKDIFKHHQKKVKKMALDRWLTDEKYRQELSQLYKNKNNEKYI
tara:strand:+ start:6313 stop:6444 length:132 start_codon:yes stop_codon:yes gene_type:complete